MTHPSIATILATQLLVGGALLLGGCATEQSRSLEIAKVTSAGTAYTSVRNPISVGKFDNRSSFMRRAIAPSCHEPEQFSTKRV